MRLAMRKKKPIQRVLAITCLAAAVLAALHVAGAQNPLAYQLPTIAPIPTYPSFEPPQASGEFLDLRVDRDNGSPTGDGSGWGMDAYKFLQDALAAAAIAPSGTTVRLWVAATDPSKSYRPDQDADNPDGTEDQLSTFLLSFNDLQLLGGFPPGGGDHNDRDPALHKTVLTGLLQSQCDDSSVGDCFEPNGTPGCDDAACCELVCNARPECCNDQWDQACADFANLVCGTCGEPDSGSCFEPHDTPGCEDGTCCALLCEVDPICCISPWDQTCVDGALIICQTLELPQAYHVLTVAGVNNTVRVDGFTITDGSADRLSNGSGAGMWILDASPRVIRVTFAGNSAPGHGGGAMHIEGDSDPLVVNTSFIANTGLEAGALHVEGGFPSGTFVNCLFRNNASQVQGGAINPGGHGLLTFINCTFAGNIVESALGAGGIYIEGTAPVKLSNCILWGNLAGGAPSQIGGNTDLTIVTHSDVQGGWGDPADMNIDEDPLFVDPGIGDYHLSSGSPCIDAADNTASPKGIDTDLDRNPRFIEDPNTPDTGFGACPIIDMGTYEYQEGTSSCCLWDIDDTGSVGLSDLLSLLASWGPCEGCPADFDEDGSVGLSDLLALLANWGPCP